jgi:sugar lactone lactonase YvrE
VCTACQPQCAGKQCGDDGCGGVCGFCKAGLACDGTTCVEDPCKGYTYAGCCDGQTLKYCDPSNPGIVVWDCAQAGPSCGWNAQGGYYDCNTGGTAAPGNSPPMECPACETACAGKECGDDGCGGLCGECPAGGACDGGHCVVDACQGVPFVGCCAGGLLRWCSHGTIEALDCAADPACGWDQTTAMYDCGTSGGEDPSGEHPAACPACAPACGGRDCGDDGCGGACGFCSDGKSCADGKCACTANVSAGCCNDAMCWIDSCGNAGEVIAQCPWGCSGFKCNECPDSGCVAEAAVESGEAGPEPAEASPDLAIAPDATDGLVEAPEWVYVEPSGGCGAGAGGGSAWLAVAACGLAVLSRRRGRAAILAAFAAVVACSGGSGGDAAPDAAEVAEVSDAPADADGPAWDLGHPETADPGVDLPPDPGADSATDGLKEADEDAGLDVPGDPDVGPDLADLAETQEVDAPVQDAEEAGEADPGLPPYDCANLPKGPFQLVKVPGAIASEDLAFDSAGNLVGSDMSALYKTAAGKKAKLWVPGVQTRAGMRFIPSGTLMLNDDTLGRVLAFDPDGAMRVVVQGLSYPNGMAVDMKGFVYVTEHDAGRVLRIHPYTGEYTVLTNKIPNPNGIVFNPDYTALYIGSFGSGYVYKMSISPDGVPGKVVEWASPIGPGGLLDGMGVDACGNVYVCEYGGTDVYRIPPEGTPAVKIVHGDDTYLPNMQWGVGMGWDPYSLYLPDGWAVGLWRLEIGVPSAPRPYP